MESPFSSSNHIYLLKLSTIQPNFDQTFHIVYFTGNKANFKTTSIKYKLTLVLIANELIIFNLIEIHV